MAVMKTHNWQLLISELLDSGMTQQSIAEFVGIKQPSLRSIWIGNTKNPAHPVGEKIIELHKITFPDLSDQHLFAQRAQQVV